MKSSVIVAKHPLHPMLILVPAGGFILALIGDVVFLASRTLFWHDFATWSMLVGVIGGLVAALPGLVDYLTVVPSAAKPTATRHMVVNLAIVALFVVNLIIRFATNATIGAPLAIVSILTIIGTLSLLYSGWLGGHLVYHHHVGVEEPGNVENANFRITLSPQEAERIQRTRR